MTKKVLVEARAKLARQEKVCWPERHSSQEGAAGETDFVQAARKFARETVDDLERRDPALAASFTKLRDEHE